MMNDLRERVPGHSLVDELLRQWDLGTIHLYGENVVIDEEAEGWYRGVLGERVVAEVLSRLEFSYTVIHSVPVGSGSSDIDHVIVGPSGVFTINTKCSPGKDVWLAGMNMKVGGHSQRYLHHSMFEAKRASELLSKATGMTVPVTGLLVFVDPRKIIHKEPAGAGPNIPEIRVLRQTELLNGIRTRPIFSQDQVARIADAAIRPGTWHTSVQRSTDPSHITREFAALEEAVGARLALPTPSDTAAAHMPRRPVRSISVRAPREQRSGTPRVGARRPPKSRRPKRSKLEKLIIELAFPVAGFIGLFVWLNSPH